MAALRPALLHALGQAQRAAPAAAFAVASMNPERAQRAKLREILARNLDTEYGRAHGFSSIRTPKDYAERVPIMTPESMAPLVSRQMAGERGILTAEAPVYYVRTTGSTGAPKHVPITPSYKRDFQKTVSVALFHLYARFPEAFLGTALYFVGSRHVAKAGDGCDVGTMSGFNFTELPPLVRGIYAWPYELFEVKDLRSRSYLSLLLAALADPSLIAGIFPAPIVYLLRELANVCGDLSRDLRQGTLPGWLELTDAQRVFFKRRMRADANLAERLLRAAGQPVEDRAALAFPSLKLVYCWTTASAALYLPELQRLLPDVAIRDAIYSACEGWASIPVGEEAPGGALALDSLYFEFIEEGAYEKGQRETVRAWELEDGKRYVVLFTTHAGLYRYLLGDIVEVCGLHHHTPRIRFVRKLGAASNLAGEKLEEGHVSRAVGDALAELALSTTFFTLAPALGGDKPGYRLHLEAAGPQPDSAQVLRLEQAVDRHLGLASFDYARLRGARQLEPVTVVCLPPGSYDAWRQARVKEGSAEAQLKVAHLVADAAQVPTL
jgi:GH3 auxin-responsive promoter